MFSKSKTGKTVKSGHSKNKEKTNKELYDAVKENEKKRKEERISYLEIISENLMLPPDVMAGAPIITIQGRNAVCVENHKRILEYTDKKIRVQTKIGPLSIEGSSLSISYYTKDELKITGYIQNVYYEQKKDKQS